MADTSTAAPRQATPDHGSAAAPPNDPATRGSLVLKDAAVQHVAERAALTVPGVLRHSSGLDVVTHRDLPRVDTDVAGGRVRASIEVAVAWPTPLAPTAQAVRESVRSALAEMLGLTVDAVDVTISLILPATAGTRPRRVV